MTFQIEVTIGTSLGKDEIKDGLEDVWLYNEIPGTFEFEHDKIGKTLTVKLDVEADHVLDDIRKNIDATISEASIKNAIGKLLGSEMTRYATQYDFEWEQKTLAIHFRAGDFKLNNAQEIIEAETRKRQHIELMKDFTDRTDKNAERIAKKAEQVKNFPISTTIQSSDALRFPKVEAKESIKEVENTGLKADADFLNLHMEAAIGRRATKGHPPFDHFNGSYMLDFWAPYDNGSDAHYDVIIKPDEQTIAINIYRESPLLKVEIKTSQDELVGTKKLKTTNMIARAIVMAKNNLVPSHQIDESIDQDADHSPRH